MCVVSTTLSTVYEGHKINAHASKSYSIKQGSNPADREQNGLVTVNKGQTQVHKSKTCTSNDKKQLLAEKEGKKKNSKNTTMINNNTNNNK